MYSILVKAGYIKPSLLIFITIYFIRCFVFTSSFEHNFSLHIDNKFKLNQMYLNNILNKGTLLFYTKVLLYIIHSTQNILLEEKLAIITFKLAIISFNYSNFRRYLIVIKLGSSAVYESDFKRQN